MNVDRLARVRANLRDLGLSQMLLVDPLSIWWLCGYYTEPYERFLGLYVSCDESRRPVMFCNRLFPAVGDACADVRTFDDTEDPMALVSAVCDHGTTLGVDKELAARWLVPLMEAGAAAGFRLASGAVDDARSLKDAREQDLMRAASATNDRAMEWLVAQLRPGITEAQIADGLLTEYRRLGASDHSFSPIVSFGDHGADPHHEPDNTPFELGDVVLFDVGCKQDWYCSDMTRTFFTAEPTEHQRRVYDTVRRANEAAEAIVAPGVEFAKIDLTARRIIEDAGWGPYFTHRLGHQIGLVDHEPGDVSSAHHEGVRPGQCFSIEPGIYLPGDIGVRIEDLLIVTEHSCEILNHYPKVLTVLTCHG
ncbi:Xaa-Pro peptidase family protein [Paratractidigestivibacter sp.]|uniref:M24 family metallopeptidase n=1 Tax=Paratractidigestivibacter sp. TaxID=2847316 RepID=UPI002AC8FF44|nr:Xaa-Pro peptidase family protein [Paratractidigestivibacter sp.]